jgi:sugar transferase EpsL
MKGRIYGRLFDAVSAILLIVFLSPLIVLICLGVWIAHGRPLLFRQRRTGLNGEVFTLYKFRTMVFAQDEVGNLLPDAERLTSFGRFLRASSLDELPELWNVLRGDMRLVGPRPLLPQYLSRYTPEQFRRHEIKPGITGWAQVNGRNALTWEEKFAMDVWYVDHRSFRLDLLILFRTLKEVFRRDRITHAGYATAPEFMGSAARSILNE